MAYDQQDADERHRRRREMLQRMRNELSDILNDYYSDFPQSENGESDLEFRIEQRLRTLQRDMDAFIREFRNLPNE